LTLLVARNVCVLTLAADEIERRFAGHRTRHDLVPRASVKK
jgi:hypothetical protein